MLVVCIVCMEINKRDFLRRVGCGAGAAGVTTLISTTGAAEEGDDGTQKRAIDCYPNESSEVIAFLSIEDDRRCLFIAFGVDEINKKADVIKQITEPSQGSVWDVQWDGDNLEFWVDGKIKQIKISGNSNKIKEEKKIGEESLPTTHDHEESTEDDSQISPDEYNEPIDGGGGDTPDWWDDPQYEQPPEEMCDSVSNLNVEWAEFCVETSGLSPKFYTKSCTGSGTPLVGATINGLNVTTPLGSTFFGYDIWFGFNPENNCIYLGSEIVDVCVNNCELPPNPVYSEFEDAIIDPITDIVDQRDGLIDDAPGINTSEENSVVAIVVGVIILVIWALFGGGIGA